MSETSYVGLSQLRVLQRKLDITANNIANANTAGFKGERPVFEAVEGTRATGPSDTPSSFVLDRGSYIDTSAGAIMRTDSPLDIALGGEGWLQFRTPEGEQGFGRDGGLSLDPEGTLVTSAGAQLLDAGGAPIVVPPGAGQISIARDGTVTTQDGNAIARVGVFDVPDIQSYRRLGNGVLVPPDGGAPQADELENPVVLQGMLESSNVNPVREMTRLIDVQRAYERANAMIDNADNLQRDTLQRIGRS